MLAVVIAGAAATPRLFLPQPRPALSPAELGAAADAAATGTFAPAQSPPRPAAGAGAAALRGELPALSSAAERARYPAGAFVLPRAPAAGADRPTVPDAWNCVAFLLGGLAVGAAARPALAMLNVKADEKADDEKMTIEKVAALGLAGVLSIAVAETVFWVLSFPCSELVYFVWKGEWINLLEQEGQLKFLAFTAGWGALGGAIAQYRTVLTAAAITPWMDKNVVKPYVQPAIDRFRGKDGDE